MNESLLLKEKERLQGWKGPKVSGKVTHVIGLLIESTGPEVSLGELCEVYGKDLRKIPCQVVGFKEEKVLLMALGDMTTIAPGSEVYPTGDIPKVFVSDSLCGRVVNAFGEPIDGKGALEGGQFYPISAAPPSPLTRGRISEILPTGIKAIDSLITLGKGQRIGIFAGPGGGKSTLLAMIAKMTTADVNVIALIGERGREVREFIEMELGPQGLAKSVVVVVTSDEPAPLRSKGASVATAIAEYFRDQGKDVVLMMDSISRYAMAEREVGLAIGEPPTIKGYPPSVFAHLPKLVERAGKSDRGSITGIYTILTEEDDPSDPIADQVRSLLDGHIVLSKKLVQKTHFPPIDVLASLSRVMKNITSSEQQMLGNKLRALLHTYFEAEDLIHIGAYVKGSNARIDEAMNKIDTLTHFLRQQSHEAFGWHETLELLEKSV